MNLLRSAKSFGVVLLAALRCGAFGTAAEEGPLVLLPAAPVDGEGIFLSQLLATNTAPVLPQIRIADAPAFGQATLLTRDQILEIALQAAPKLVSTNWAGSRAVRVTRRARSLCETEVKTRLTEALQREYIGDRGDLELRLLRPWGALAIPDEPCTMKILDLPTAGISPNFVVRFELRTSRELVGSWQAPVQARVWKEIWAARTVLRPGQLLNEADLARERRDVLTLREAPVSLSETESVLEIAEHIQAGAPLYARSVRPRPVIRRGQIVEAQLQENGLVISLKVEALESGAPGQLVRVRNLQSRKEFRGKIQNENTILVFL